MAAVPPLMEPRGIPTVFGEVFEKNVTFCIDTSGSMYKGLEMVKEHLLETLLKHASKGKPTMFNIVEFNSEVTQWSDKMVTCTPETVRVAKDWINKLSAKTGTNTKDALMNALRDPLCDAIYLVTDGLPDHHPVEILDQVANIGKLRPIHCIYLSTEETTESAAIEFLEDLAIESYGSLHIVSLTTHGCVERITPIYRADHANERIIRTLNGSIYPDIKQCSVSTTLQIDPDESLLLTPRISNLRPPYCFPPWGPYWFDWLSMPHRYYYPYGWSRYRPARSWLKAQEQMIESIESEGVSPAAGSLLINKKVLARRLDDGYFYIGTVKSQILSDKFLVAFGPCKHGKFKDTVYQDTFVYDIIDYEDAKRHTILTGDKVLGPWEPEGERFGPGTVLEGHEKRQAHGPDDKVITVSFTNGKVEKVPLDTAVWLPTEVYERLALELKMPKEARETLWSERSYPRNSLEGYPTSGPHANPEQYDLARPVHIDVDPMLVEAHPWRYPYYPPYPVAFKKTAEKELGSKAKTVVKSEDINALVPGTNITHKELDHKITSQLMEHKLLLDEKETEKGTNKDEKDVDEAQKEARTEEKEAELQRKLEERRREWEKEQDLIEKEIEKERLLKKREKQEENTLKKSVSFKDEKAEGEGGLEDSGVSLDGSSRDLPVQTDLLYMHSEDAYFSDPEESTKCCERGVNTDSSLLYRPCGRLVSRPARPLWKKYWRADPSMPITNSSHGPFRETALQAPLEARCQRMDPYYNCEWTSPVYKYVDPMAKHAYSDSVERLIKMPQTPAQLPDRPQLRPPPQRPMSADAKEAARREFKRRRDEQRRMAWNMRMADQDKMADLMKDQHRERIMEQITREKNRQYQEQKMVEFSREAKKHVSKELRQKIEANQKREQMREEQRIQAMQRRREHREDIQRQRDKAIEETVQRRNEIKRQRSQERWENVQKRLDAEEAENARKTQQFQDAKLNRIRHFQNLEEQEQLRKDMRIGVSERHLSMFQSTVM